MKMLDDPTPEGRRRSTATAGAEEQSMVIHRQRTCALVTQWEVDLADVESLAALQQKQPKDQQWRLQWLALDSCGSTDPTTGSCWQENNVAVDDNRLELHAGSGKDAKLRVTASQTNNATEDDERVHRFRLRTQFPAVGSDAQALVSVRLPAPLSVTMALTSAPEGSSQNSVLVGSSQNASVVAELPCAADITATSHDLEFVWDSQWLRWYVDDVLLFEEAVGSGVKGAHSGDNNMDVMVELSVDSADSTSKESMLMVEKLSLVSGNALDVFCGPQYAGASNCREKAVFTPRLGSIQGSLSTDEVETFIDEVAAKLPLITKVEELGKSVEGRPLRALCLGACHADADQHVPQALYTGMHHAREPISMMNLVYTIDILATDYQNGDFAALELLASRQLWFVLVVNPDGYAHNEAHRVWEHNLMGQRKSARPTCDASPRDAGVDLNRNYDACFARDSVGSSNKPCGDDYAGPSAFSEPETQAIRALVERNTSDFSVALNYHSFGEYFNLPFACQPEGEPDEPGRSVFKALAQEMTRYNGFGYGQSWKDSNLYTVNGETSDWMWQAHGIFAMSPEVGPGFELSAPVGFWPPEDQVPQLSAELHYSNVYLARAAGPVYELDVASVEVEDGGEDSKVMVSMSVSNNGLQSASAKIMGSIFLNGSSASTPIHLELEPQSLASGTSATDDSDKTLTIEIPAMGGGLHQSSPEELRALYLVIQDAWSCQLFRVSVSFQAVGVNATNPRFQVWTALSLPRCGMCEAFGAAAEDKISSSRSTSTAPLCAEVDDVAVLEPVHVRSAAPFVTLDPTTASTDLANVTETFGSSGSTNVSAGEAVDQLAQISSPEPFSLSWFIPALVAAVVGLGMLGLALYSFIRRWRTKLEPGAAKTVAARKRRRQSVQYSRVETDAASSPSWARAERLSEYDGDEDKGILDAECGERRDILDEQDDLELAPARSPASERGSIV